jgi:16S rRNA (guanine527-N7)-methyltransferase
MFRELLSTEFAPYRTLSQDQLDRLEHHYNLLVRWNERMNLTRIRDLQDIVRLHFCESLFLGEALPGGPLRIVDIGSGAGFPGIPVAILRPDCSVDLVESHQRKAVFLREAARNLSNVQVLSQRAETLDPVYDWAISRAVRPREIVGMNMAPSLALLVGESDANSLPGVASRVPWGAGRSLVKFHVERDKI